MKLKIRTTFGLLFLFLLIMTPTLLFASDKAPPVGAATRVPPGKLPQEVLTISDNENDVVFRFGFAGNKQSRQSVDGALMRDDAVGTLSGGTDSDNVAENVNDLLNLDSTATGFSSTPVPPHASAGVYTLSATFSNISDSDISDLFFEVGELTGGNVLLNADGAPGGVGAILSVESGADGLLEPGETFTVDFEVGLAKRRRFSFLVDAFGQAGDPTNPFENYILEMPQLSQNPLILRVVRPDGIVVDYFGVRSEGGLPTDLQNVIVQKPDEEFPVSITMENNRPKSIVAENGTSFDIEWITDTEIRLTTTTPDGKYQVSMVVDLENPEAAVQNKVDTSLVIPEREHCSEDFIKDGVEPYKNVLGVDTLIGETASTLVGRSEPNIKVINVDSAAAASHATVNVSKCDQAYDSVNDVSVLYKSPLILYPLRFPASQVSTGVYQVEMPIKDPDNDTPVGDACETIFVDVLGKSCPAISVLNPVQITAVCSRVAAAVTVIGTPAAGVITFAGCESALAANVLYCRTIGALPGEGIPTKIARKACDTVKEFELPPGEIQLTANAFDLDAGAWAFSPTKTYPSTGPFAEALELAFTGETTLGQFYTAPADPAPGEGYTAYAEVFPCAGEAVEVTIEIQGSDGYYDSVTYNSAAGLLTLNVPGGGPGVIDVLGVTINGELVRTISITF